MTDDVPTRDRSEPYDLQLSKDEATVLRVALKNAGIDHNEHITGQVVTLTDENIGPITEAVMEESVTSMARGHQREDLAELNVVELCNQLSTRLHHEFNYGENWKDYV